jgi:hypothetical protein
LDIRAGTKIIEESALLVRHGFVPVIGYAKRLMPRRHAEAQVYDARRGRVGCRRSTQEGKAKQQDRKQAKGAQHG